MWQRQIQWPGASGRRSRTATGCGSWMTTKSYSPSNSSANPRLLRVNVARAASSNGTAMPWSPLWMRLVTSKNGSSPG